MSNSNLISGSQIIRQYYKVLFLQLRTFYSKCPDSIFFLQMTLKIRPSKRGLEKLLQIRFHAPACLYHSHACFTALSPTLSLLSSFCLSHCQLPTAQRFSAQLPVTHLMIKAPYRGLKWFRKSLNIDV